MSKPFRYGDRTIEFRDGILLKLSENGIDLYADCAPLVGHSPETLEETLTLLNTQSAAVIWNAGKELKNFPALRWAVSNLKSPFQCGKPISVKSASLLGLGQTVHLQKSDLSETSATVKCKINAENFTEVLSACESQQAANRKIRLDANLSLSCGQLSEISSRWKNSPVLQSRVEFLEDPYPQFWKNGACSNVQIPLAIDEELSGIDWGRMEVKSDEAPDYFVLKPSTIGTIEDLKSLIEKIEGIGKKWLLSSLIESEIGIRCLLAAANSLAPNTVHGFGTLDLLTQPFLTIHNHWNQLPEIGSNERSYLNSLNWLEIQ